MNNNNNIQNILQPFRLIQMQNQSPIHPALDMTWLHKVSMSADGRLVSASDRDWSRDVETWPEWRSGGHQTRLTATPPPSQHPTHIWILDILGQLKSNLSTIN